MDAIWYVRFRGTEYNRRGFKPGLFALVNGLHFDGLLTDDEKFFRRRMNDWYEDQFPNPGTLDPSVYDPDVNPGAVAWFKTTAHQFLAPIPGYLRILEGRTDVLRTEYAHEQPGVTAMTRSHESAQAQVRVHNGDQRQGSPVHQRVGNSSP